MDNEYITRYPLNGTLELTARCNLQCKMCLIRIDGKRMAELGGRERTTEEWIQMAKEIQKAGTIGLLLTGGEPMLRPDFIDIYKEIAQMGFILTLYTNATLITSEIMEVLKKYPPHRIGITVYGASPETYERVTGNANAYYSMREGINQLKELSSQITIRTTLIKDNIDDLNVIREWSVGLGVDFNVSRIVTKPVRGGIANVEECRLTPEENITMLKNNNIRFYMDPLKRFLHENPQALEDFDNEKEEYDNHEIENDDNYRSRNVKTILYGCSAGISNFCISWDGKLIGCQMLGDCWTYPFSQGFKSAWNEFPKVVKMPSMPNKCINCKTSCSACPATRLAETGQLNGIPGYLCNDSKLASEMENRLITDIQQIANRKEV